MLNCREVVFSEEEYLALDRAAEIRSEFLDGEMFAMSGVSISAHLDTCSLTFCR